MKFDSFLTPPRWEILQILAKTPSSPIELAEKLDTTVAYMSQQLKLLDAAELVIKTKTGATEKGKPRSIYKLSSDMVYFVSLNSELADKKLIRNSDSHNATLKIWMVENSDIHYYFEKLYWKLNDYLSELEGIYLDLKHPKFVVVTNSSRLKALIGNYVSKFEKKIDCDFVSSTQFNKIGVGQMIQIFGSKLKNRELKGGKNDDE